MRAKLYLIALLVLLSLLLVGCGGETEPTPTPAEPHRVESIRLDTPTPAPTPEPKQVTVYSELEQASALVEYGRWYVSPLLTIRSGWREAESIGAEEFGQFFVSLSDERRGYAIDGYFRAEDDTYCVPSDAFCATIAQFFDVNTDYLLSLALYDAESDTFVLPAEGYINYSAEVYRVEESDDELKIRYILYAANPIGNYFENTGNRYELLIEKTENASRYVSSTPVTDDKPMPAPQNGDLYLNTEITSYYARRGMTVDATEDAGDITLVSYSGAWSGLESFNRRSGEVLPVVYFSIGDSGRRTLVSPPFNDFASATLGSFELRENGDVRLLVRNITTDENVLEFSRVYTWTGGAFESEIYSAPLLTSATIGAGGRGRMYDIIAGERSVAFAFDSGGTVPTVRATSSASTVTLRFVGIALPEDTEITDGTNGNYGIVAAVQSGEDTVVTLALASSFERYRINLREPIAGKLPHIELELVSDDTDYPNGW